MHQFDMEILKRLKDYNEHHATCINAKTSATVGLGFLNEAEKRERQESRMPQQIDPAATAQQTVVRQSAMPLYEPANADKVLDPLTTISWHDTLMDACEDYWDTGNGYIEVVRRGGRIKGLHHVPSTNVYIHVDSDKHEYHYVLKGEGSSMDRHFAVFGDKQEFMRRVSNNAVANTGAGSIDVKDEDSISEIIHFRRPSSRSKWYGSPDWVSAVPMIELGQMLHQYKFDFFLNRGVPEFLLFITGAKVGDAEWTVIENAVKANIGLGNSHKSSAINLPGPNFQIQVEKLAMESKGEDDFEKTKGTIALSVVTSHKVPPLLAGIQIPGKLGATNELSQALIAFQSLVIGQAQRLFQATLARTLGEDGSVDVSGEDFTFKTITDDLDPQKMDTIGKMHQPLPQANAEGRDVNAGVRD